MKLNVNILKIHKFKNVSSNSSSLENQNVPENINRSSDVSRNSPSPSRKRQRKGSGDERDSNSFIYKPELIAVEEIKVEPDPLDFEDNRSESHKTDNPDQSKVVQDNNDGEYPVFTDISREDNQINPYIDSIEAGSSGLQMVSIDIS